MENWCTPIGDFSLALATSFSHMRNVLSWQPFSSVNIPYSSAYNALSGIARSWEDYFPPSVSGHSRCFGRIDVDRRFNKMGLQSQNRILEKQDSKRLLFCLGTCKWFISCPPIDHNWFCYPGWLTYLDSSL